MPSQPSLRHVHPRDPDSSVGPSTTRRATATRSAWGVADQVIYGLSNAAMTFLAARILDPNAFGAFAVAYTSVVIIISGARSLASEPFSVLFSDADHQAQSSYGAAAAGMATVVGLVTGLLAILLAVALGQPLLAAFGLALPALCLQDYARYHLTSIGEVRKSFAIDVVWVVVQFGIAGGLWASGQLSITWLVATWGMGAVAAVIAAMWFLELGVRPDRSLEWWRETKEYGQAYFLEFLAVAASGRSIVYVLAAVSGAPAAGAYRGAEALFGPLTTAVGGLRMVLLPEVVRRRGRGIAVIRRASLLVALGMAALAVVATVALVVLGRWLGPLLLGDTWVRAAELLVPVGVARIMIAAAVGPFLGLRAIGATTDSVAVRWVGSIGGMGGAVIGAVLNGAVGSAWGFALGMTAMLAMWQVAFERAARTFHETAAQGRGDDAR